MKFNQMIIFTPYKEIRYFIAKQLVANVHLIAVNGIVEVIIDLINNIQQ